MEPKKTSKSTEKRQLLVLLAIFLPSFLFIVWMVYRNGHERKVGVSMLDVTSADSIIIHTDSIVAPVIYRRVPDLSVLSVDDRKQRFIHLMLPAILLAYEKMANQRSWVIGIKERMDLGRCTEKDSLSLVGLLIKYRVENAQDLIDCLHPHPVSIVLAQGAIESGWGTSRFFKEANNVYGMWSYSAYEKRIVAGKSRKGKEIYLRAYDSIFESVYDYLYTIGRSHAYEQFRVARLSSKDPYRLIWFLSNYSESRTEYVKALRNMIEFNKLTQYDHYKLAEIDKEDEFWKELLAP